jgi:hypothetical protein
MDNSLWSSHCVINDDGSVHAAMPRRGAKDRKVICAVLGQHSNPTSRLTKPVHNTGDFQKPRAHVDDCLQGTDAVERVGPRSADTLCPMIEEVERPWSASLNFLIKMAPYV